MLSRYEETEFYIARQNSRPRARASEPQIGGTSAAEEGNPPTGDPKEGEQDGEDDARLMHQGGLAH